jgi:hypothetical protein
MVAGDGRFDLAEEDLLKVRTAKDKCRVFRRGRGGEVGHLRSSIPLRGSRGILLLALSSPHEILQIAFKVLRSTMLRIGSPFSSQTSPASQPAIMPQSITNCGGRY